MRDDKKKILFVVDCYYPYGSAFSSRARNLIKLFMDCGYLVHLIARNDGQNPECDEMKGYDVSVEYIDAPRNSLTLSGIGTAKPYIEAIRNYIANNEIDYIISNNLPFIMEKICEISKQLKVPYIIEQCEWYDSSSFKFGKFNPYYREVMHMINKKIRRLNGVIAISRLLEKHYANQGIKTIRIPTILDVEKIEYRIEFICQRKINIAFAGSLGKGKENIHPVFEALRQVPDRNRIHIDLFGPSEKQVIENINNDMDLYNEVKGQLSIHGRISQLDVEKKVREADYTFIIRPDRLSSNAGFPTKLAESMAVGTPVIANDTGDIGMYIENGKNGFLVEEGTPDEIASVLKSIISMNDEDHRRMRLEARKTAEVSFNYKKYCGEFSNLL